MIGDSIFFSGFLQLAVKLLTFTAFLLKSHLVVVLRRYTTRLPSFRNKWVLTSFGFAECSKNNNVGKENIISKIVKQLFKNTEPGCN